MAIEKAAAAYIPYSSLLGEAPLSPKNARINRPIVLFASAESIPFYKDIAQVENLGYPLPV